MNHCEEFKRKRQEDRRLVILRFLQEEPDYRLNVSLLQDALDVCGNTASRDQIIADGEWLAEVGLVVNVRTGIGAGKSILARTALQNTVGEKAVKAVCAFSTQNSRFIIYTKIVVAAAAAFNLKRARTKTDKR